MPDRRRKGSRPKTESPSPRTLWEVPWAGLKTVVGLPGFALLLLGFLFLSGRLTIPPEIDLWGRQLSVSLLLLLALVLSQGRTLLVAALLALLLFPRYPGSFLLGLALPPLLTTIVFLNPRHPFRRRNLFALGVLLALGWLGGVYGESVLRPLVESWRPEWHFGSLELGVTILCGTILLSRLVFHPTPLVRSALWSLLPLIVLTRSGEIPLSPLTLAASLWILGALEEAHFLSFRDALTRLPGRRAFDRELAELGRSYVIAMVDVDHFKRVNDRHGHDVGDQVLARIGARLARLRGGRCFRYGGEEFAVVYRGRKLSWTKDRLENLRERIAREPFGLRGKKKRLKVTVSIGAAARSPKRSRPEEVLAAADKALYRAKRAGRNRVIAVA